MCEATLEFRNDYLRQRRAVVRVGKLGVLEEKERKKEPLKGLWWSIIMWGLDCHRNEM